MLSGVASVWAVASPMAQSCAAAAASDQTGPSPSEAQDFVAKLNQLRVSKGLNALVVDSNLTAIAQDWSAQMAGAHAISHRSNLSSGVTSNSMRLGENVGVGPDVNALMSAFTASQTHYANMVDPSFTHIGVGTFRTAEGLVYTAHEFAYIKTAAATPAPAPVTPAAVSAPTPRPATPQVTTPVTPAPTTVPTPPTTAAPTSTTQPVSVAHASAAHSAAATATQHASHSCNG
jgi:hypothetical protein